MGHEVHALSSILAGAYAFVGGPRPIPAWLPGDGPLRSGVIRGTFATRVEADTDVCTTGLAHLWLRHLPSWFIHRMACVSICGQMLLRHLQAGDGTSTAGTTPLCNLAHPTWTSSMSPVGSTHPAQQRRMRLRRSWQRLRPLLKLMRTGRSTASSAWSSLTPCAILGCLVCRRRA